MTDTDRIRDLSTRFQSAAAESQRSADYTGIPYIGLDGQRYIPEKFYELIDGIDFDLIRDIIPSGSLNDAVFAYTEWGTRHVGWISSDLCID